MKISRKFYSGYSEVSSSGLSYIPAQVAVDYVLDPTEKALDYIEESPVHYVVNERKVSRIKKVIKPLNSYLKYLKERNNNKK